MTVEPHVAEPAPAKPGNDSFLLVCRCGRALRPADMHRQEPRHGRPVSGPTVRPIVCEDCR